jgi:hypothetical protein
VPHILSHHPRCGRRTRSFIAFAETRATNGGRPHPLRSLTSGIGEFGQGKAAIDEQRQFDLIDNLSLTVLNHQLKFGVDYRWLAPFSSPFNYEQFVLFSGIACPSTPPCAGYALSGTVPGNSTTASFAESSTSEPNALLSQNFLCVSSSAARPPPNFKRSRLHRCSRWSPKYQHPELEIVRAALDQDTAVEKRV